MGVNEKSTVNSHINLDSFQKIFDKFDPGVVIESLQEAQGSGRGDNYTASLYRVQLTGYKIEIQNGLKLKWEKSVICKRLPDNAARREAFKSVELFRNEVEFYTTIMPELIAFQKSKTCNTFKAIPQSFIARNDLLIMEDLQMRNFKMADRKMGLTANETESVLKELAVLHSLSLAYKLQHPKKFAKLKSLITEGVFCETKADWYKNYYIQLTKNAFQMVSDVVPENSKYIHKFNEFIESNTFFNHMIQLVSKESPLSVICHGDCWTNNFLYRYDESGKVIETSLVDFQLIRYGSAVLDVASLIYCCTTKKMRDENLDDFLKLYTSEFFKSLKLLGPIPAFCKSEEECLELFRAELKVFGKFALGIALDIIPISTCSSEDAPDLYMDRTDESTGAPILNFPLNDLCKQKLSDVLIDLVDSGIL